MAFGRSFPRYEIISVLGRGGMGTVSRAWDAIGRREVALKELHGDVTELDRRRFEREVRTLAVLRHENIVRLLDAGRRDGRLYCALELLPGLPLTRFLDRPLPDHDEIRRLVRLVASLLDGVEYLHRAGLVHRDLKDGNAMVLPSRGHEASWDPDDADAVAALLDDPDPRIKLVDFGLVLDLREPTSAEENETPGTALYMAPERASGTSPLDPRSDLYSLGVLLYRLLGHEFPYATLGESLSSGRAPPRPLQQINPACSPALCTVVCRQLARAPHRRSRSADELAADLLAAIDIPRRPRIHAPTFRGRALQIERLEHALRRGRSGEGRCILVGGPRGAGKTWLLRHSGLGARAVIDGLAYFEGGYRRDGSIHEGLRDVLASILLELLCQQSPTELARALGPWGSLLIEAFEIAAIGSAPLDELIGTLGVTAERPPAEIRHRLVVDTAVQILALAAARSPIAVVIEDVHLAEELDLRILRRLGELIEEIPLTLVASYRRDSRNPVVDSWLREMRQLDGGSVELIALEGLGDNEVESLVGTMLESPTRPAPSLVATLLTETGGVAGSVEERLRELWSRGQIVSADGEWRIRTESGPESPSPEARTAPPETPAGGLLPWLGTLDAASRHVLEAAAVIGDHFDPITLAALLSRDGTDAFAAEIPAVLRGLLDAGYLESTQDGIRFSAPSLRESAAELSGESRRRELHRRLARILLESTAEGGEEAWLGAARHFRHGGEAEKAIEHYVLFARHAATRGAHLRSLEGFERALELVDDDSRRSGLLEEKGCLHGRIGDLDAALTCLREARRGREGLALVPLLEEEGKILQKRGEHGPALRLFEDCRSIAGDDSSWTPQILYRLGCAHFQRGDLATANELFMASLEKYRDTDDHLGLAMVRLGQGLIEKRRGELATAIKHIEEAVSHGERSGHKDQVATYLHNLANLYRTRGDLSRAVECLERSMKIREGLGDRPGIAICLNNLGRTLGQRGEIRKALRSAEQALAIFRDVGDKHGVLISRGNIGSFRYYMGDLRGAESTFTENLSLALGLDEPRSVADCHYCLGRIAAALGDPEDAERHLASSLGALPEPDDADLRALYSAELALSRLRLGNREGASDALREGWELVSTIGESEIAGLLHHAESEFHLEYEELEAAEKAARKSVEILDRTGWKYDAARAHRQLARVYREIGPDWIDHTEKHFEIARRAFEEMECRFELARTLVEEARLWELLEEGEESTRCFTEAAQLFAGAGAEKRARHARERLEAL